MSTKPKKPKIEIKHLHRQLPCQLTDKELIGKGKEAADLSLRQRELESEKKRITDDFKARLSEIDSKLTVLNNCVSTGIEYREVKVEVAIGQPDNTQKTLTRTDTGELLAVEELTSAERQLILIDEPQKKA